jgi:hypothetical protein
MSTAKRPALGTRTHTTYQQCEFLISGCDSDCKFSRQPSERGSLSNNGIYGWFRRSYVVSDQPADRGVFLLGERGIPPAQVLGKLNGLGLVLLCICTTSTRSHNLDPILLYASSVSEHLR